jgi:3-oxoacyl-[acyl-carrier-protein] synthase-1
MLRLAAPALREALGDKRSVKCPVFIGTPEVLPGGADAAGSRFLEYLALQSGVSFDLQRSKCFALGKAAIFHALQEARKHLEKGGDPFVIVGGVDTYVDSYVLAALERDQRILQEDVTDGFIPGEGAAFLLVGPSAGAVGRNGSQQRAILSGVAVGAEVGHRFSDQTYRGDGLAQVFQDLLAGARGPVTAVYSGMNGESFGSREWAVAYIRNRSHFADVARFAHPADCFGDLGAAAGPVLIGAAAAMEGDSSREARSLVFCSSDGADRGACLVERACSG